MSLYVEKRSNSELNDTIWMIFEQVLSKDEDLYLHVLQGLKQYYNSPKTLVKDKNWKLKNIGLVDLLMSIA